MLVFCYKFTLCLLEVLPEALQHTLLAEFKWSVTVSTEPGNKPMLFRSAVGENT